MSISEISKVTKQDYGTVKQNDSFAGMGKTDFLALIIAQLKYQDPLSPVSNFDFMSQTAQFNMLEQVINLNAKFDMLTQLYDMTYTNTLLGKSIEYTDSQGNKNEGVVEKVERIDGLLWLYCQGSYIAPSWVTGIVNTQPWQEPGQEGQNQDGGQ